MQSAPLARRGWTTASRNSQAPEPIEAGAHESWNLHGGVTVEQSDAAGRESMTAQGPRSVISDSGFAVLRVSR
jgi:hypothetical protein